MGSKIRVGVLRGGPSSGYDLSLATGGLILRNLPNKYESSDILVTKNETWHWRGLPTSPTQIKRGVDVIFNALHGTYGEDGRAQQILDRFDIPYTAAGPFAHYSSLNKNLTKKLIAQIGAKTPIGYVINEQDSLFEATQTIFNKIAPPWVIKPTTGAFGEGVILARHFEELLPALERCRQVADSILVEEYVSGREVSCGIIDDLRGHHHYALPVIQTSSRAGNLTDNEIRLPAHITDLLKAEVEALAQKIHQTLGLCHYSVSDFIVNDKGVYFLETNTLPLLDESSILGQSLAKVGIKQSQFIDHVLGLALSGK